jgi:hypothetical protein
VNALAVVTALPFAVFVIAFFAWRGRTSRGARVARGIGWVALLGLVGVGMQAWWAFGSGQTRWSVEVADYLRGSPIAWWVQFGGHSVQRVFEATVGERQTTMISNWPHYYALVWVQTLCLAAVVGWRLRRRRGVLDPVVLLVTAAVLVNAWLGRAWPWWGS